MFRGMLIVAILSLTVACAQFGNQPTPTSRSTVPMLTPTPTSRATVPMPTSTPRAQSSVRYLQCTLSDKIEGEKVFELYPTTGNSALFSGQFLLPPVMVRSRLVDSPYQLMTVCEPEPSDGFVPEQLICSLESLDARGSEMRVELWKQHSGVHAGLFYLDLGLALEVFRSATSGMRAPHLMEMSCYPKA